LYYNLCKKRVGFIETFDTFAKGKELKLRGGGGMYLFRLELGNDMDFTMRGQTKLGRQLDPGVNGLTLEGVGHIELGFTDLVRTNSILVKNLDAELVVAASFTIRHFSSLVSHLLKRIA
jgi:hypothetical protein